MEDYSTNQVQGKMPANNKTTNLQQNQPINKNQIKQNQPINKNQIKQNQPINKNQQ